MISDYHRIPSEKMRSNNITSSPLFCRMSIFATEKGIMARIRVPTEDLKT
jgi:hypothetical protein